VSYEYLIEEVYKNPLSILKNTMALKLTFPSLSEIVSIIKKLVKMHS
jgi:hypothetical protein